jgi:hypothetical protein
MNLQAVRDAIRAGHMLAGSHAVTEAAADGLTLDEVWQGIISSSAEMIEEYPSDPRGPSCLIYCEIGGSPEHAVVAFPSVGAARVRGYPSLAFLVTCYRPGGPQHAAHWSPDFKKRVTP